MNSESRSSASRTRDSQAARWGPAGLVRRPRFQGHRSSAANLRSCPRQGFRPPTGTLDASVLAMCFNIAPTQGTSVRASACMSLPALQFRVRAGIATLKPDPCQFRDEALAAMQRVSRPWTSSYTGNSVPSIQAAVLAGLGVSVLGAHSVQNGMRVVQDELPDLPSIDIMLFGEEKFGGAIAKALVNFVLRSVQEQENLMTKAA